MRPGPKKGSKRTERTDWIPAHRASPTEKAKYIALGGVKWFREALKKARMPKAPD